MRLPVRAMNTITGQEDLMKADGMTIYCNSRSFWTYLCMQLKSCKSILSSSHLVNLFVDFPLFGLSEVATCSGIGSISKVFIIYFSFPSGNLYLLSSKFLPIEHLLKVFTMYIHHLFLAWAVTFLPTLAGSQREYSKDFTSSNHLSNSNFRLPGTRHHHYDRTQSRKGVGSWWATNDTANMLEQKLSWTYNWESTPEYKSPLPPSVEFVPMIGSKKFNTPAAFASIKAAGSAYKHILNCNEPDIEGVSVDEAIRLYPFLLRTGLKIGSPALGKPNTHFVPGNWFFDFMVALRKRNLPLDFIALHYYSSTFNVTAGVADFRAYVKAYHDRFHLPIWVTEYAMVDYSRGAAPDQRKIPSLAVQAEFAASATKMLQSLWYVERYAWFALSDNINQPDTALYRQGVITEVGKAYLTV